MLGRCIKEYISSAGMKYGAVADRAEIPQNVFSAIINEKRKITAEEYFSICKALDVPLDQFYVASLGSQGHYHKGTGKSASLGSNKAMNFAKGKERLAIP